MTSVLFKFTEACFVVYHLVFSFETVPSALKRMYSAVLGGMFCGYVRSGCFLVSKSFVSSLNFCLTILPIIEVEF